MKRETNLNIIDDLKKRSLKAFEEGYSLESAIIVFQTVEHLLRITISGLARGRNIEEEIIAKCTEDEQSFYKLTLYYELLNPQNPLTKRLQNLNNKRNSIMHRIFCDFESIDNLQSELNDFVMEGVRLNEALRKDLLPEN